MAFLSSHNISHPLSFPAGGGGGSCEGAGAGEGEAGIREILALAEAQELQAKLVSAGAQVEQLKEVVRRLNEEQEANMAELITEHRQGLEEERQSRERQEFEGRLERLAVGGGTNKEAKFKREEGNCCGGIEEAGD